LLSLVGVVVGQTMPVVVLVALEPEQDFLLPQELITQLRWAVAELVALRQIQAVAQEPILFLVTPRLPLPPLAVAVAVIPLAGTVALVAVDQQRSREVLEIPHLLVQAKATTVATATTLHLITLPVGVVAQEVRALQVLDQLGEMEATVLFRLFLVRLLPMLAVGAVLLKEQALRGQGGLVVVATLAHLVATTLELLVAQILEAEVAVVIIKLHTLLAAQAALA
jgi:hypothetical protein